RPEVTLRGSPFSKTNGDWFVTSGASFEYTISIILRSKPVPTLPAHLSWLRSKIPSTSAPNRFSPLREPSPGVNPQITTLAVSTTFHLTQFGERRDSYTLSG